MAPASAAGDAAAGQEVFARCTPYHSTAPSEKKVVPSLAGVFGRKSGSEPGYSYSAALKAANITWDEHTLDQFLANPAAIGMLMNIFVPWTSAMRPASIVLPRPVSPVRWLPVRRRDHDGLGFLAQEKLAGTGLLGGLCPS